MAMGSVGMANLESRVVRTELTSPPRSDAQPTTRSATSTTTETPAEVIRAEAIDSSDQMHQAWQTVASPTATPNSVNDSMADVRAAQQAVQEALRAFMNRPATPPDPRLNPWNNPALTDPRLTAVVPPGWVPPWPPRP